MVRLFADAGLPGKRNAKGQPGEQYESKPESGKVFWVRE